MSQEKHDMSVMKRDFTPGGMKLEGAWENDRNSVWAKLYEDIICEAWDVKDRKVICAHHLTFVRVEVRGGFEYQIVQEVPSADALIFDHEVARRLWGDRFLYVLAQLAREPVERRDQLLSRLYYSRVKRVVEGGQER